MYPPVEAENHDGVRPWPSQVVSVYKNASRLDDVVRVERIIVTVIVLIAQGLRHFGHRGHHRKVGEGHGERVEQAYRVGERVPEHQEALRVAVVGVLLGIRQFDPERGAGPHVDEALRLAVPAELLFSDQQPLPGEEAGIQGAGVRGGAPPRLADGPQADVLRHVVGQEVAGDLADEIGEEMGPVPLFYPGGETHKRRSDSELQISAALQKGENLSGRRRSMGRLERS